jgi:hypothetical protein
MSATLGYIITIFGVFALLFCLALVYDSEEKKVDKIMLVISSVILVWLLISNITYILTKNSNIYLGLLIIPLIIVFVITLIYSSILKGE